MILFWIVISTVAVSLISLIGITVLWFQESMLKKILLPLVALSAGTLLGSVFFHILPEAIAELGVDSGIFFWLLVGFSLFFFLEQFIHWHHCHKTPSEHKHPVTYLILVADGVHNFIDGMALAGAFLFNFQVGLVTWLAIVAHEVPQELGDFGVLIHGGWSKSKALFFNFISALTAVAGGLLVYLLSWQINMAWLLPFAAGNFIYIACSDLIPEVKHNISLRDNLVNFGIFILGIALVWVLHLVMG
ncbi:MAG: ZIP family metal transporter [Patescibacteria group bacterium]